MEPETKLPINTYVVFIEVWPSVFRLFYFSLIRPEELFYYKDQQEYQDSSFGVKIRLPPLSPGRVVADHMSLLSL